MTFDVLAAEKLALEVSRTFAEGLQELIAAAAKEVELDRQRLDEEKRALTRERHQLQEAWARLNVERSKLECAVGTSIGGAKLPVASLHDGLSSTSPSTLGTGQNTPLLDSWVPLATLSQHPSLASSALGGHLGTVPSSCSFTVGARSYSVLPLQAPDAKNLGHDHWNQVVEVPDGWEVLSSTTDDFPHALETLAQHRWGAIVLGVRAEKGFDAYWTPLFGDGTHAGQLCQADVDWIESLEGDGRRFRMTYTGLRLVIASVASSAVLHGPDTPGTTPMATPAATPGAVRPLGRQRTAPMAAAPSTPLPAGSSVGVGQSFQVLHGQPQPIMPAPAGFAGRPVWAHSGNGHARH